MKSQSGKFCNTLQTAENLTHFAECLRSGNLTCQSSTSWHLRQISINDSKLKSFVHIDKAGAIATARNLDQQLKQGVDLGPLMGVPISVKDIITVDGTSTRGGSLVDIEDVFEGEGGVVSLLKASGCIILGKNRTIELAAGAHNLSQPTPWNPWNLNEHFTPGGSSNGSAVAVAAGLTLFALGSDTGGSVRLPASMCSQFGFKPTQGLWDTSGILPLCKDLDTLGLITRSAEDAAIIFGQISGTPKPNPLPSINGIRLGVPTNHYFDNLESEVAEVFATAVSRLEQAGVSMIRIELPDTDKVASIFSNLVGFDLLKTIGHNRFLSNKDKWDPVLRHRLTTALDLSKETLTEMRDWLKATRQLSSQSLKGLDGFISPTSPITPKPVSSIRTPKQAADFTLRALQNTRPANVFNYCTASIPIKTSNGTPPVGFQVHKPSGQDSDLLSLCQSIESLISS